MMLSQQTVLPQFLSECYLIMLDLDSLDNVGAPLFAPVYLCRRLDTTIACI